MCKCEKPTINGTEGDYRGDRRGPATEPGDDVLIDAPGRCGIPPGDYRGVDCHAYHHTLVRRGSKCYLLTRHGAGEECHALTYGTQGGVSSLLATPHDCQFWLLHLIYNTARMAGDKARQIESAEWAMAAANKRIKTRKARDYPSVKVWIAPPICDTLGFSL